MFTPTRHGLAARARRYNEDPEAEHARMWRHARIRGRQAKAIAKGAVRSGLLSQGLPDRLPHPVRDARRSVETKVRRATVGQVDRLKASVRDDWSARRKVARQTAERFAKGFVDGARAASQGQLPAPRPGSQVSRNGPDRCPPPRRPAPPPPPPPVPKAGAARPAVPKVPRGERRAREKARRVEARKERAPDPLLRAIEALDDGTPYWVCPDCGAKHWDGESWCEDCGGDTRGVPVTACRPCGTRIPGETRDEWGIERNCPDCGSALIEMVAVLGVNGRPTDRLTMARTRR